jgi:hypothetical protein
MNTLQKKSLFWDVNDLDPEKDADFIIARILNLGDVDDFGWAMRSYGRSKVEGVMREKAQQLSEKSFSFWCQFFNIDPLTCTKKPLTSQPSAFSQK